MKKIFAVLISLAMILSFSACGGTTISDSNDRGTVKIYLDGEEKCSFSVSDFAKKTSTKSISGNEYYGKLLSDITGKALDLASVKAVFTRNADDSAAYFADASSVFVASYKADADGEMKSIEKDGKAVFNLVSEKNVSEAVTEIYLLTKAQDWSVIFSDNGAEKILTIDDFMAMNPTYRTLSHMYDGGSSTFEGEFLSVDTKTLMSYCGQSLVLGTNDSGDTVYYAEHKNLSFVGGVQASGSEIKIKQNTDLKASPFVEKSGWMVYYFVLVNGNSYHDIVGADIGLSCIKSGTGMRWMCTPLESITLETSDSVKW